VLLCKTKEGEAVKLKAVKVIDKKKRNDLTKEITRQDVEKIQKDFERAVAVSGLSKRTITVSRVTKPNNKRKYEAISLEVEKTPEQLEVEKKMMMMIERAFENEVNIVSKLNHPNILKLDDSFDDQDKFYMVMEYFKGGDLSDLILPNRGFSEEYTARVFEQVLSAVSYLHGMGVVHRDLKPENILVTQVEGVEVPQVKLIDFGLSRCDFEINKGNKMKAFVGKIEAVFWFLRD